MPLIYAGIDEAGYGPLLGPLCVGLSVFRVEDWEEGGEGGGGGAPNLWTSLGSAVCRETRDKRNRIAVDDSKKLKLANSATTRHPLTHLERGVLAFLGVKTDGKADWCCPETDHALLAQLGVNLPHEEWYGGTPCTCPVGTNAAAVGIAANTLRLSCQNAGICTLDLCCEAIGEGDFNRIIEAAGTKAAATETALVKHLWTVWDRWGAVGASGGGVRVVCDRQGGRATYTAMLKRAFPGADVRPTHESDTQSRYEIVGRVDGAGGQDRHMHVLFLVESERQHLPVALASMAAKLTREMLMHRFNQFWRARLPELKPTAGYRQDAWRWLEDAAGILSHEEKSAMIRKA